MPHFLSSKVVERFVPMMRRKHVSEVARSPRGFLTTYLDVGGAPRRMGPDWLPRRKGFIARHMAQMIGNGEPLYDAQGLPTRRHLALIAWAYSPDPTSVSAISRRLRGRRE